MRWLHILTSVALLACDGSQGKDSATPAEDLDNDGFDATTDCNDENENIHPEADEVCDGIDNDCDGFIDEEDPNLQADLQLYLDADGDSYGSMDPDQTMTACQAQEGWVEQGGDCDDDDAEIHPDAQEYCDLVDNDCDGEIDEAGALSSTWYLDSDGDDYGTDEDTLFQCEQPKGYVLEGGDCDDGDVAVNPGATEYCNQIDDDCDGETDEDDAADASTWYLDSDMDGFGDEENSTQACDQPQTHVADSTDCDDGNPNTHPGAVEICNDIDDDCDKEIDEDAADAFTWYRDADGDGFGDSGATTRACERPSGYTDSFIDCDDSDADINPDASELCDGVDNDCDGFVDASNLATFIADDGTVYDLTSTMGSGSTSKSADINLTMDGTLYLCDGVYNVNLAVSAADLTIQGISGAETTILSGDRIDQVIAVTKNADSLDLEGLTVRRGAGYAGGGISSSHGLSLSLTSCIIEGNEGSLGGGIYQEGGTLTLYDVTLSENDAEYGAGAYLSSLTFSADQVELDTNIAATSGGGLLLSESTSTLQDALFSGNTAADHGGGFYQYGGSAELTDSQLMDNDAYGGGAATAAEGALQLYDCDLSANTANAWGGGLALSESEVVLDGTAIYDNLVENAASEAVGGGLVLDESSVTCTGSTKTDAGVYANVADWGGAAWIETDDSSLISDTCDWGESTEDNVTYDIVFHESYTAYDYGDDASFECLKGACDP